ncbi:MAG: polyketide synthase dehydratase domain-containing protein, partial [Phycisphaerae bacterium]
NKAARRLAARLSSARVVSLNWGPWEGGMVTPALQAEFERRGVALIPMVAGGACVADELADASDGSIEVVLGASFEMPGFGADGQGGAERPDSAGERKASDVEMHLAFEHSLDLESHPFLRSHVLDGRPVLPVAMMMEWMAHAAMHLNPGLRFQGMDELRILKGVIHNGSSRPIRFYVGRPRRSGEVYDVDVSVRSAGYGGAEAPHARANVVLTSRRGTAPAVEIPGDLPARPYERGVVGAYRDVLFHGDVFRGIRRVHGYSGKGMVAEAETAGKPVEWMTDPLRSDWLGDPLAIDSAFQVAILWCHEEMGAVSLPSYLGRYRQYCDRFPDDGVTVALQVRRREPHRITGDFTFMSSAGAVVARMEGYECTVDAGLRAAFRSEGIAKKRMANGE